MRLRLPRLASVSIVTRILAIAAISLVALAVALLGVVKQTVESAMFAGAEAEVANATNPFAT